ncbi:hypothetical protein PYW08_009140 [Mythimna loreyi]|uniref:Uncharacterized protein n=1 Tax=Mythimna loreyi TaxID=667449 RepID=A0ACC2Q8Y2_9NEOP|nr:hypothetical protein PYW08_009140 [Mythimna loreyi]
MDQSVKEELIARKRLKEISRTLLPDALPRKRARKQPSPERTECHLVPGTPTVPPSPKLQPWQMRMQSPIQIQDQMQGIQDRLTPVSSVVDLQVDWTTGLLRDLEGNTASALLLADAPKSPNHQMTDVPVAVLPTIKPNVKLINEAIKGKDSNELDESLARWLEVQSDEEEDVDLDVHTEFDDKLTPAHIMDECDAETRAFVSAEDKSFDQLLAELLPKDHLTFDWSHDRQTFTGTRETFTGQTGPTFTLTAETKPVDVFFKFFDDELLDLIYY